MLPPSKEVSYFGIDKLFGRITDVFKRDETFPATFVYLHILDTIFGPPNLTPALFEHLVVASGRINYKSIFRQMFVVPFPVEVCIWGDCVWQIYPLSGLGIHPTNVGGGDEDWMEWQYP